MKIIVEKCKKCLACVEVCPTQAISEKDGKMVIDRELCISCGCCASACPNDAVEYERN